MLDHFLVALAVILAVGHSELAVKLALDEETLGFSFGEAQAMSSEEVSDLNLAMILLIFRIASSSGPKYLIISSQHKLRPDSLVLVSHKPSGPVFDPI